MPYHPPNVVAVISLNLTVAQHGFFASALSPAPDWFSRKSTFMQLVAQLLDDLGYVLVDPRCLCQNSRAQDRL
jgi:hypothetical protein